MAKRTTNKQTSNSRESTQTSHTLTGGSPTSLSSNGSTNAGHSTPSTNGASTNQTTPSTSSGGAIKLTGPNLGDSPTPSAPSTFREKLADASKNPRKRKRKAEKARASSNEEEEAGGGDEQNELQRKLDRVTKWMCFLCFTNKLWESAAKECYGDNFDIDSNEGQGVRLKIYDMVKGIKNRVIKAMEDHVKEVFKAPENSGLEQLYITRPLLVSFFSKLFSPINFFGVWRYMNGYVEYEGSSELGQYYIKSIYINLAVEVKIFQDTCRAKGSECKNARNRLLAFYNQMPLHKDFKDVDKSDFKELKKKYRSDHSSAVKKDDALLEECFVSIGAPPAKKRMVTGSEDDEEEEEEEEGGRDLQGDEDESLPDI